MFAVVKTGGKQYKVAKGDIIRVEKLDGEAGDKIELNEVLAFSKDGKALDIGAPLIKGAVATAEIREQTRNDKIIVFKKKRRQNYRRKKGHMQHVTVLEITDIKAA